MLPPCRRFKCFNILAMCNKKFIPFCTNISKVHSSTTINMSSKKRTIFSGIQPTGTIHLGNYIGAVRKWVEIQDSGDDCIFSIVDLHALTMPHDHYNINYSIRTMVASLIACGINYEKCIIYQQSHVPEHANLAWILGCMTTMPRLSGLAQFKEKSAQFTNKSVSTGLFLYPVLQAADILLYKATHIPVGSDQLQNINLCIHLANLFNNQYGPIFPVPEALMMKDSLAKIKSLKNPLNKMSKSELNPLGRLDLLDSPEDIMKKIKKAVTDFISEVYYDPENRPGVSNLMTIHSALSGKSYEEITVDSANLNTGKYKDVVGKCVADYFEPIRKDTLKILNDKEHINYALNVGSQKAQERAKLTMEEVYSKIGLKLL